MMDDKLVRLSDVLEILSKKDAPWNGFVNVQDLPAVDAVEVVRCRKCKFNGNFPEIPLCRYMHYPNFKRSGNGYCSMGQRREDGLYKSLKRGLEEAIAFENGEIECRTEIRKDGDV